MVIARCFSLVLIGSLISAVPVVAADSPLAAFPQETGVLVRLKTPQKTLQKTGDLATKVDRVAGAKVQLATPLLGTLISNQQLKGVDLNRDWWLGVFPQEAGEPGVVFAIPANDAAAMQEAVGGDFLFQKSEDWLLYTDHKATAELLKTHAANSGPSISSRFDKMSQAVWDEGDLSVFINVPQLMKIYKVPFEKGVEQVNTFIEQFPALIPPNQQGVDMKAVAEMYSSLLRGLVQALKDAEGCAAGLSVRADGIWLHEFVKFSADSKSQKALAGNPPTALKKLEQLPAGQLSYAAVEVDTQKLIQWSMDFSLGVLAAGDTEKEKQIKEWTAEYKKIRFGQMAVSFGLGDPQAGALRGVALLDADQPAKVRDLSHKVAKLTENANFGGMKVKITYELEGETYGDLKADVMRTKYEVDPQNDPLMIQSQMIKILYGPDGMTTRVAYVKNTIVQAIGGTKAEMQAALDAAEGKNAVGEQAAFTAIRQQLLPQANAIGLVDVPSLMAHVMGLAIQSGAPLPLNENDLEAIRGKPSFMGVAISAEAGGLRAKTVVPLAQMQGVARAIRLLESTEQPQRQPVEPAEQP